MVLSSSTRRMRGSPDLLTLDGRTGGLGAGRGAEGAAEVEMSIMLDGRGRLRPSIGCPPPDMSPVIDRNGRPCGMPRGLAHQPSTNSTLTGVVISPASTP